MLPRKEIFMAISDSASSPEVSASALFEYLHNRFPSVTLELIASALRELEVRDGEGIKAFAKRLRSVLNRRGVPIKHTAALEAAARVLNGTSWHEHRQEDLFCTLTVLISQPFAESQVPTWAEAGRLMADACKAYLLAHPDIHALQVQCRSQSLFILGSRLQKDYSDWMPIVVARPLEGSTPSGADWLKGASLALEWVRRHVEESGLAVLDGFAAVHYCERPHPWIPGLSESVTDDAPNTELVVVRNDNSLVPGGYEVARGDELTCWLQLEQASDEKVAKTAFSVDEDGAWRSGNARFEWKVVTLRRGEFYPGLALQPLTLAQSEKLLHRFKLSKRVVRGRPLKRRSEIKPIGPFGEAPESYRVNRSRVMRALCDAGLTWEAYCAQAGEPSWPLDSELPVGFVLSLLMHLKPQDPNFLFARPRRDQLVPLYHDEIVRAMLPRVNHVRYRTSPDVPAELKEDIVDAIENLSASTLMRRGVFTTEDPLPDLVYSSDAEELNTALEKMGLVAYVGVMPHLATIPKEVELPPDSVPWATGYSLFVDIDVPDMPRQATGT
jgi:hypothetical protein